MAWEKTDVIAVGRYVQLIKTDGIYLSLPGSATDAEVLDRVRAAAQGWTPSFVEWDRGVLGIGSTLRIFGQAQTTIPSSVIATQAAEALNSFWGMTAVQLQVLNSNNLADPRPAGSEWTGPLQMIALAVIAVAVVYGIRQIREISD